jgi:enediyne polyketide synthase
MARYRARCGVHTNHLPTGTPGHVRDPSHVSSKRMSTSIAIVGLACRYPDARSPTELWENVLAQRRAFRRLPAERLSLADYFSDDPAAEALYAREAAVLEGYEFDRARFHVGGSAYRSADLVHWLALDVADQALREAGFPDGAGLPRETTGVLLGNTLTGEFSRAALLRLRWPYVRRVVAARLAEERLEPALRSGFLERLEALYKAPFEPVGEETLAGGLSNTIAGRICNHFHLRGGGFTLDGACSSSLLAVCQAASALAAGDLDVALAGGVDLSLDPFELIGFAKAGALARAGMRVYDQHSGGFLPGEGCGFVVLMRARDARARGLRIHALLRGWGFSSDGGGGITRPEVDGQRLALSRAYARAGYDAASVALFEGHGTGTAVGDEVEIEALAQARATAASHTGEHEAVLGSVKALFGHTKAAAGVAGLLKAVLAVSAQVQPPNAGLDTPRAELTSARSSLRTLAEGRLWPRGRALRAGVSSFGFGGINAHVAIEGVPVRRRTRLTPQERRLLRTPQDAELLLLAAPSAASLDEQAGRLEALAPRLSQAELADVAAHLAKRLPAPAPGGSSLGAAWRAAVVARSPSELHTRLGLLRGRLRDTPTGTARVAAGVCLGHPERRARLAFLFPGQGSPARGQGGLWTRRFDVARRAWEQAQLGELGRATTPGSTEFAQPAVLTAQAVGLTLLRRLGLHADVALGHSLGELTALHWAGAYDLDTLLALGRARGLAMAAADAGRGAMASVAATPEQVATWIAQVQHEHDSPADDLVIACLNAARQTVVAGRRAAVDALVARAVSAGASARRLDTAGAFHSPLMEPARARLRDHMQSMPLRGLRRPVISTVTGGLLARDHDLRALLEQQLTQPVRFEAALALALRDVDLALEVGPGQVLAGLAGEHARVPVVALDCGGASLGGLLEACGLAFALGAALDAQALFDDRFTRPFDIERPLRFLANPCESAPALASAVDLEHLTRSPEPAPLATSSPVPELATKSNPPAATSALGVLKALVARRTELPEAGLRDDLRLARDLHLSSLAASELINAAARQLGLPAPKSPLDYADATLDEVAASFDRQRAQGARADGEARAELPAGLADWVHAFVIERVPRPLRPVRAPGHTSGAGSWTILGADEDALVAELRARLAARAGQGVVVCLPEDPVQDGSHWLLEGARQLGRLRGARQFVVVHQAALATAFARTLHAEQPEIGVCVIDPPAGPERGACIEAELAAASSGVVEAYYIDGTRHEPALRLLDAPAAPVPPADQVTQDVLLVSGGGKGIGLECALALAEAGGFALALLGRAHPQQDPELAANLQRLEQQGLRYRYLVADVTQPEALRGALAEFQRTLGPVRALLHAAGFNNPRLAHEIDAAGLERTYAPKVRGLEYLLAALAPEPLRLLVTLGSVIGRFGLRGQSEYALANARLTWLTQQHALRQPHCRCLAVESSVWAEIGMGVRLGSLDALRHEGITALPPARSAALLARLALSPSGPDTVLVAGRLGAQAPLPFRDAAPLPFQRFLERPRVHYPGLELVVEAELSTSTDPYVEDHVYEGQRLFPAVMGLEAMAQAALALVGADTLPTFEDVRFERPVSVPVEGTLTLRLLALRHDARRVEVALRCSESGFQADHFRTLCVWKPTPDEPGATQSPALVALPEGHVPVDPHRHIYGVLAPHGPAFQRLLGYRQLEATRACFDVAPRPTATWFAPYLPQTLVLGDPGARDTALHALQASIPHGLLLPSFIARLRPHRLADSEPLVVTGQETASDGRTFEWTLALCSAGGQVLEDWSDVRFRRLGTRVPSAWNEALVAIYLTRRVRELIPDCDVRVALERAAELAGSARSDQAMASAAGRGLHVRRAPDGRPEVDGGLHVSAAHADDVVLAVAASDVTACDVEHVATRPQGTWRGLLGVEGLQLAETLARQPGLTTGSAETHVWCALECLKKARQAPSAGALLLGAVEQDGWVSLTFGELRVASLALVLEAHGPTYVFAILGRPGACAASSTVIGSASKTRTSSATSTTSTTCAGRAAVASTSCSSTLPR